MSVNNYKPHLLVLPEDDANAEIANGFQLTDPVAFRQMFVLPVAGGWRRVLDEFRDNHVHLMNKYPLRRIVLLIDCDGNPQRIAEAKSEVPPNLADRVFVLGVLTEPEGLKGLGAKESIGKALAEDCVAGANKTWSHDLLRHNIPEAKRLREDVRGFLFTN